MEPPQPKLLAELGVTGIDALVLEAVAKTLSWKATSATLGLTEGRTKHRFFKTCGQLQVDQRTRPFIDELLAKLPH